MDKGGVGLLRFNPRIRDDPAPFLDLELEKFFERRGRRLLRLDRRHAELGEELDASLPDGAARVIVLTRSGKTLTELVMHAKGSLANPLSDADIEAKLRECARSGETGWNPDRLIEAVWRLETVPDIAELMNAAGGASV